MTKTMLPLIREEDKIRCVSCGDCVRACLPGTLELTVSRVPVIAHPEKCDHEGRCLVACPQKVYPCLWPQDLEETKKKADQLIEKSKSL